MFILVVVLILTALFLLKLLYPAPRSPSIPGPKPSSLETGNLPDIAKAGSLHQFLMELHTKFGDIAGFRLGPQYVVSICSPELFKEHQGVFDRPPEIFKLVEPMIGPKSIQYANKEDGKNRRKNYDRMMSHASMKRYIVEMEDVAEEVALKFADPEVAAHPLCFYAGEFGLKVDLLTFFGIARDNTKIKEFYDIYQACWHEIDTRLTGNYPGPGSSREKAYEEALESLKAFVREIVAERAETEITKNNERLIDIIADVSPDEETLLSDAITYVVGASHTSANSIAWCFYYLMKNPEVQEKLYREIVEKLGSSPDINHVNLTKLTYLRQVYDETLRISLIGPIAARFQDEDSKLGGHIIPAGTPVIHALGVSLMNPKYWPNPSQFDPERFNPENSKERPTMAFQPFGFAGKRICPGYRFAYVEAAVFIVVLLSKYKVTLVDGQSIKPVHGLVTHPSTEIMIKTEPRY